MILSSWLTLVRLQLKRHSETRRGKSGLKRFRGVNLNAEIMESRVLLSEEPLTVGSLRNAALMLAPYLEDLNSVTVVTHGYQLTQGDGDSLRSLSNAIRMRADAENGASRSAWLLDYDVASENSSGFFDFSTTLSLTDGLPTGSVIMGSPSDIVLQFDWAPESNEPSAGWGEAAGDALFGMLVGLGIVNPAAHTSFGALHFIGHSFGTAVTSEAVERLAAWSVPVDQATFLDPHDFPEAGIPIDQDQRLFDLGSPTDYGATVWDNVTFADVYYQVLPTPEPEGRPIPGAYNHKLTYSELPLLGLPHSTVWSSFYLNTVQDMTQSATEGYAFSHVAQGTDPRPAVPRPSLATLSDSNYQFSFYSSDQAHSHTTAELLAMPEEFRPGIAALRSAPVWNAATFNNGDFSFAGDRYDGALTISTNLHCAPRPTTGRGFFCFSRSSTVDPFNDRKARAVPFFQPKLADFCPICADLKTRHRPNRFRSVRCMTAI